MRVMTWNIKTGGGARLPAIAAVVRRERPDILALQELRGFDRRRMAGFADALGMDAHLAPSHFGQAVAVLVKAPLRITGRRSVSWALHHAAAVVTVDDSLTVVSTHLNPFSPSRRRREAIWLTAKYARRGDVLLAGDLNSLDPFGDHDAAVAALETPYRKRHLNPDGSVSTDAMAAFRRGGFTDLWPLTGEGDGRTAPTTQGGGAEFSGMRLDYILASPSMARRAGLSRVVRGGETEYASDHYPLVSTFSNSSASASASG